MTRQHISATGEVKTETVGNSLAVQWLGLSAFSAGVQVQSLVRELRSPQAVQCSQKKKKQNKTNKKPHRNCISEEMKNQKSLQGEFPVGPVVKTPHFHGRGRGCDPWSGNQDPTCHVRHPPPSCQKRKVSRYKLLCETDLQEFQQIWGLEAIVSVPSKKTI